MHTIPEKKCKIKLSDYDYEREIEFRKFLASLNTNERAFFQEIQLLSLRVSKDELEPHLTGDELLSKFQAVGLIRNMGNEIVVNKELRKYFELDAGKFDGTVLPDTQYVKGLLQRLPQHLLPVWYPLPQSAAHIFSALVEKMFRSPKLYEAHVADLKFNDPIAEEILQSVYTHPELSVEANKIQHAFSLDDTEFHKLILLLEFHFALFLSYEIRDGALVEVLTPLKEWREWTLKKRALEGTSKKGEPDSYHIRGFDVVQKMGAWAIQEPLVRKLVVDLELGLEIDGELQQSHAFKTWKGMALEERGALLLRRLLQTVTHPRVRDVEKSLKHFSDKGWVLFDDFFAHPTKGAAEDDAKLERTGREWGYVAPALDLKTMDEMFRWMSGPLAWAGILETGTVGGKECFRVTSWGRAFLV